MIRLHKIDHVEYQSLRGFEKAAILMNFLGPGAAKRLLKHMEDGDIRKLLAVMQKYRIVPIDITKKVLEEFYEMINESDEYIFSDKVTSKDSIVDAVGEERARGILGHLIVNNTTAR